VNQLGRITTLLKSFLALLAIPIVLVASSCKVPTPVTPPPIDGSDPHFNPNGDPLPSSYTHYISYTWKGAELASLRKLSVIHPASIRVIGIPGTEELNLFLMLDIQADHHDELSNTYRDEVLKLSDLQSADAKAELPERDCQETRNAQNQVTQLRGICVRELTIVVPPQSRAELDLKFKKFFTAKNGQSPLMSVHLSELEKSALKLRQWRGAVSLDGGHSADVIQADHLSNLENYWRGFTANLKALSSMHLQIIENKIQIDLKDASGSSVTLEGEKIEKFPYIRQ